MPVVRPRLAAIYLTALLSLPGFAHEFWLEPLTYQIDAGERLRAHIKIGQYFKGNTYAYFPHQFEQFNLTLNGQTEPVESRMGTTPAVGQTVKQQGLAILTYESDYNELTYDDAETFQKFLRLDGLEWVREKHQQRGLPPKGFTEVYRRFAKAYISVGHGEGQDSRTGFPLEWLLEENPYQLEAGEELSAQLLWQGEPFADSLTRVFLRTRNQEVEELRLTTDADGRVTIPYREDTEYLVSSVHMIEPDEAVRAKTDAVWESLWASAVFYRQ